MNHFRKFLWKIEKVVKKLVIFSFKKKKSLFPKLGIYYNWLVLYHISVIFFFNEVPNFNKQ